MKQIIKDVLDDMSEGQINLGSEAARETISNLISVALKTKGTYTEYDDSEIEEQEARETWVCEICGENTFEVDYDYIGSGANHLGCELELELGVHKKDDNVLLVPSPDGETMEVSDDRRKKSDDRRKRVDRRSGDRRDKNWSQKKHEDKVFNQ